MYVLSMCLAFRTQSSLMVTFLQRLELAFDVGAKLGAPPLLDPEDVCDIPVPERRSMITYLGVVYKAFKG